MLNFYEYYNKNGLDKEHYGPLIDELMYDGTLDMIKMKEIEHIIKKHHGYAYMYACHVIKGRWEEAEPYIMKKSFNSYMYARDVIKDRWPEAEPVIKKDNYYWTKYCKLFNI